MSKLCSVCGYPCEDTAAFCPSCGYTFPELTNVIPSEANQNFPPQGPQAIPPSGFPQTTQVQIQAQPPKKSRKTLWLVLGITGGVLLLLFILFLILFFVFLRRLSPDQPLPNQVDPELSIFDSNKDMHEYYYDDYDHASLQSEAFADTTTEEPVTTEGPAQTEEPVAPEVVTSDEAADFRPDDLLLYPSTETGEGTRISVELNHSYLLDHTGILMATEESGLSSMLPLEHTENASYRLGRGITPGSSFETLVEVYKINRSTALWRCNSAEGTASYYYFSSSALPDTNTDNTILIGWRRSGEDWARITPEALYDFWADGTLPECDELLLYQFHVDGEFQITDSYITYGTPEFCGAIR